MDMPLDAAVIGAGWAGLGVSYALAKADLSHRVLERGRIGETWLTQRWDSFHLNTPKFRTVMPGDRYEGSDHEGFYTRDEFVALLEDYARRRRLPVATNTPVTALTHDGKAGVYRLITPAGELTARAVVIASGSLNRARRPEVAQALPPGLLQIDTSGYRSPDALPAGRFWWSEVLNPGPDCRRPCNGRTGRLPVHWTDRAKAAALPGPRCLVLGAGKRSI
jgi:putative flavoprotein involved in K+ transport